MHEDMFDLTMLKNYAEEYLQMNYAEKFRFLTKKSFCRNHTSSHTGGGGVPCGDPKDKVIRFYVLELDRAVVW